MGPVTIAIICATVFGVVATLTAFIRHILLSRDKVLNDLAQQRALVSEARELERLRIQMISNKRFDSHYQVLGTNKDAIAYLDQTIENNFRKKFDLIQRYADLIIKESVAIISGDRLVARKALCDNLKHEIDLEVALYDKEIEQLQMRRANLWDCHAELHYYLLDQEALYNANLNNLYQKHAGILEKMYQRHNDTSDAIAKYSIHETTETFKSLMMMPFNFLLPFFKPSMGIAPDAAKKERLLRNAIIIAQDDLNALDNKSNCLLSDYNKAYSSMS